MEFDGFPPLGKGKVFSIFWYVSYAKFRILRLLFILFFSYLKGTDADTLYENFAKPKIKVSFYGGKNSPQDPFPSLAQFNILLSFKFPGRLRVGDQGAERGAGEEYIIF